MEIDKDVYGELMATGRFEVMDMDVDEVGDFVRVTQVDWRLTSTGRLLARTLLDHEYVNQKLIQRELRVAAHSCS